MKIGLEPERLQAFVSGITDVNSAQMIDDFIEQVSGLYLASVIKQEVKS